MKITFETPKGKSPLILVDGTPWAMLASESRGRNGTAYTFRQMGAPLWSVVKIPYENDPGRRGYTATILSDAAERRANKQEKVDPLELRAIEKARELIRLGYLRDPKIVAKEHADAMAAKAEKGRQRNAEAAARWRKRAVDLLMSLAGYEKIVIETDVQKIIEAMKQVQTE